MWFFININLSARLIYTCVIYNITKLEVHLPADSSGAPQFS